MHKIEWVTFTLMLLRETFIFEKKKCAFLLFLNIVIRSTKELCRKMLLDAYFLKLPISLLAQFFVIVEFPLFYLNMKSKNYGNFVILKNWYQ